MLMYVRICLKREFLSVIILYAPGMERSEEGKDSFREELKGCIEACEEKGRELVIGYMNTRVGDSK